MLIHVLRRIQNYFVAGYDHDYSIRVDVCSIRVFEQGLYLI